MIRGVLDWPTHYQKRRVFQLLATRKEHNMIFAMTLTDSLNRLYNLRELYEREGEACDEKAEAALMQTVGRLVYNICKSD